ncbi:unnamed protein product [Anisakis simplex]|uniref:PDZ domain-containing protein n=1 Tax=Anisakis simplex TaxID=6269 RepID=A0A0M3JKV3_ANISI|nr:unnamed protein product [Anisakis simplex]
MRPLGFNILQSDGYICVGGIQKNGPAEKSGNMFHGDRIKAINVSFDGILLEDAISLLSCAAPYKVIDCIVDYGHLSV